MQTVQGKNDQLNQYATFVGKPGYFQQDLARYRRVTPEDVKRVGEHLPDRTSLEGHGACPEEKRESVERTAGGNDRLLRQNLPAAQSDKAFLRRHQANGNFQLQKLIHSLPCLRHSTSPTLQWT